GLVRGPDTFIRHLLQIVAQGAAGKPLEDILPGGILAQVGPQHSRENGYGSALAYAVGTQEACDPPVHRHGQAVEGKAVRTISMHRILHLLREVGDIDGLEGAFAHAYSAAHAEVLGDQRLAILKDYGLI